MICETVSPFLFFVKLFNRKRLSVREKKSWKSWLTWCWCLSRRWHSWQVGLSGSLSYQSVCEEMGSGGEDTPSTVHLPTGWGDKAFRLVFCKHWRRLLPEPMLRTQPWPVLDENAFPPHVPIQRGRGKPRGLRQAFISEQRCRLFQLYGCTFSFCKPCLKASVNENKSFSCMLAVCKCLGYSASLGIFLNASVLFVNRTAISEGRWMSCLLAVGSTSSGPLSSSSCCCCRERNPGAPCVSEEPCAPCLSPWRNRACRGLSEGGGGPSLWPSLWSAFVLKKQDPWAHALPSTWHWADAAFRL